MTKQEKEDREDLAYYEEKVSSLKERIKEYSKKNWLGKNIEDTS